MELGGEEVVAADARDEGQTIVAGRRYPRAAGITHLRVVGVHEIVALPLSNAAQERRGRTQPDPVPAHVRNADGVGPPLFPCVFGKAENAARKNTEARRRAKLFAGLEKNLEPQADA